MLIIRFACILMMASALPATQSKADVFSEESLQPNQLVGAWEALVEREGMAGPSLYQILFVSPQEAWLVEAGSINSEFAHTEFFGRLQSANLDKGQIILEFTPLQGQSKSEYVSVRIEGRATRAGDLKFIEGKIILKRKDDKVSNEHVFFANNLWTRWIVNASIAAEEAINEVRHSNRAK
ncbi:MAG: hypothetical protein QOD84_2800 [Acidobacteriaceae bacterium]|jgi:hypothetical protein